MLDEPQPLNTTALTGAIAGGVAARTWTEVTVRTDESLEWLMLRVATSTTQAHTAHLIAGTDAAAGHGLDRLLLAGHDPTLYSRDSLTYLARRPGPDGLIEIGAAGCGPAAGPLTVQLADLVHTWHRAGRITPPTVTIHPAGTRFPAGGGVISKPGSTITVTWPDEAGA
ncbi:hypothetical protein R8Z50_22445 [Longispora sp. K20-0274]|uniref:hypothetical protein n=1 Tax=Longispora sp. K20-0274 TaxID=3088255 RepID=UPI00399BF3A5